MSEDKPVTEPRKRKRETTSYPDKRRCKSSGEGAPPITELDFETPAIYKSSPREREAPANHQ
jgi:hypothetical protein